MQAEGTVGNKQLAKGAPSPLSLNEDGSLLVTQSNPKNMQSTRNGDFYHGANLGGSSVTTQAGLSATTPALTLYNPVGSGVYLVINEVNITITTSPAAACGFMLCYNAANATAPATTTLATVTDGLIGSTKQPAGQCYRICTLAAAPLAIRMLGGTTGASAIGAVQLIDKIEGSIIVIPGVAMSIQSTSAAAILASISWTEITI